MKNMSKEDEAFAERHAESLQLWLRAAVRNVTKQGYSPGCPEESKARLWLPPTINVNRNVVEGVAPTLPTNADAMVPTLQAAMEAVAVVFGCTAAWSDMNSRPQQLLRSMIADQLKICRTLCMAPPGMLPIIVAWNAESANFKPVTADRRFALSTGAYLIDAIFPTWRDVVALLASVGRDIAEQLPKLVSAADDRRIWINEPAVTLKYSINGVSVQYWLAGCFGDTVGSSSDLELCGIAAAESRRQFEFDSDVFCNEKDDQEG